MPRRDNKILNTARAIHRDGDHHHDHTKGTLVKHWSGVTFSDPNFSINSKGNTLHLGEIVVEKTGDDEVSVTGETANEYSDIEFSSVEAPPLTYVPPLFTQLCSSFLPIDSNVNFFTVAIPTDPPVYGLWSHFSDGTLHFNRLRKEDNPNNTPWRAYLMNNVDTASWGKITHEEMPTTGIDRDLLEYSNVGEQNPSFGPTGMGRILGTFNGLTLFEGFRILGIYHSSVYSSNTIHVFTMRFTVSPAASPTVVNIGGMCVSGRPQWIHVNDELVWLSAGYAKSGSEYTGGHVPLLLKAGDTIDVSGYLTDNPSTALSVAISPPIVFTRLEEGEHKGYNLNDAAMNSLGDFYLPLA